VNRTIVIGVGNPILTDDGVGWRVARELRSRLADRGNVDVIELCAGGIAIMEALVGYDRAVVVDSMEGGGKPGSVYRVAPDGLEGTRNSACAHDTTFRAALETGGLLGLALPGRIEIWGIEPGDVGTFGEDLSEAVAHAVPRVVDGVLRTLAPSRKPKESA
jgi:hydrogenase maturation protease